MNVNLLTFSLEQQLYSDGLSKNVKDLLSYDSHNERESGNVAYMLTHLTRSIMHSTLEMIYTKTLFTTSQYACYIFIEECRGDNEAYQLNLNAKFTK